MAVLGVDVGGTFTDAVLIGDGELRTAKVRTLRRQEESVLAAALALGAAEIERFTHGTSAQRMQWFQRGMQSGDPKQCDTFARPTQ